jgi:thiamine biosynthesis protein ThiS
MPLQVTVNGMTMQLPSGCTVAALLAELATDAARVAVERNQDVVPRARWDATALADGDQIEIVTFVGGG